MTWGTRTTHLSDQQDEASYRQDTHTQRERRGNCGRQEGNGQETSMDATYLPERTEKVSSRGRKEATKYCSKAKHRYALPLYFPGSPVASGPG